MSYLTYFDILVSFLVQYFACFCLLNIITLRFEIVSNIVQIFVMVYVFVKY